MSKIPIIDSNDEDFKEKFDFNLWSTQSNSDYRNDKERPYNGQPHTSNGIRGKQVVSGITMRDLRDCLIQAFLVSSSDEELQKKVFEISDDPDIGKGTKYAAKGNWRPQDVYEIDFDDIDPIAVAQNLTCFVEHYMGIFPNLNLKGIPSTKELIEDLTNSEPNQ